MELFKYGYMEAKIATELNISQQNVNGIIKSACNKMSDEYHMNWLELQYRNNIGMKLKKCANCNLKKPAINDFFRYNAEKKDELSSKCIKCEEKY